MYTHIFWLKNFLKFLVLLGDFSALFQVFQNLTSSEKQHVKHLEKLLSKFKIITKTNNTK
jgi:hypothetical protein